MDDPFPKRQKKKREKYYGFNIHPLVVKMYEDGTIKMEEAWLYSQIASLVYYGRKHHDHIGCYASNAYLAKKNRVSIRRVQQMLSKLKDADMVKISTINEKRVIQTPFMSVTFSDQNKEVSPCNIFHAPHEINFTQSKNTTYSRKRESSAEQAPAGRSFKIKIKVGSKKPIEDDPYKPIEDPKISTFDKQMAKELKTLIETKRKIVVMGSQKKWANEFRILRGMLNQDEDRIIKVFNWYKENIGKDSHIPIVNCGLSFRKKFLNLEAQIKIRSCSVNDQIEIDPKVQKLVDDLCNYKWPKGSAKQLPVVVQHSVNNFRDFWKRLHDYKGTTGLYTTPTERFITNMKKVHLSWQHEIKRHWEKVFERVHNWENWSGQLKTYIWKIDSKEVTAWGSDMAQTHCGKAIEWDRMIDKLYEE